ncbi:MAG: HAD-IB family hydrolase [Bacteroidota bacterium]
MSQSETIAAFDFDHTLLKGDSMQAFFRYVKGDWGFVWGVFLHSWILTRYFVLKNIDRLEVKERLLAYFLGGMSKAELEKLDRTFAEKILPKLERQEAIERLKWHKSQGHTCLMVTASMDIWTASWAANHHLYLIATSSTYDEESVFRGKVKGTNNWGPGKRENIQHYLKNKSVDKMYAYGDSRGDKEMLEMADFAYYRRFKD